MTPPIQANQETVYCQDSKALGYLIGDVMREWGVTRSELAAAGRETGRVAFVVAARAELFRACYFRNMRPAFVAKAVGCTRRTVARHYAECRKRLTTLLPISVVRVAS